MAVRLSSLVPITADTLTVLLLGNPEVSVTQMSPSDKPLLERGVYEAVVIATDADAFAAISRGTLSRADVLSVQSRVVEKVNRDLSKQGFSAKEGTYPPTGLSPKTLAATLIPVTQNGGSEEERAHGKGKTMVLVRLTITDPVSGVVLAQRDYYSGADVKRAEERRPK